MLITIDNQVINRLKDLWSLLNLSVFSPSCIVGESYDVMQASSDDCYVINLISKFFSTTYDSANVNLNSIATTNLCKDIAIDWLLPYQHKDWFGVPIEVWNPPHYTDAYIPVKNLLCRCTHITEKVRHSHHYCVY